MTRRKWWAAALTAAAFMILSACSSSGGDSSSSGKPTVTVAAPECAHCLAMALVGLKNLSPGLIRRLVGTR